MEVAAILLSQGTFAQSRIGVRRRGWRAIAALEGEPAPRASPELSLRQRHPGPPAGRTDPLVVPDRRIVALVAEPEALLDGDQVLRVHARREGSTASTAERGLLPGTDRLVEANPDLRRTLEDVEELSE